MVLDVHLGLRGGLVRSTDTRKLLNDTLARLLIQALRITLLGHLDGDIDVDLDERQARLLAGRGHLVQLARGVPVLLVRRDKRRDGDRRAVGEQLGDLCDAADVLVAVCLAEAQVLVQPEAHIVAVQSVGRDAAVAQELVLQLHGEGGLARGRQAGEPDCEPALVAQRTALGAGQAGGVEGDVAILSVSSRLFSR